MAQSRGPHAIRRSHQRLATLKLHNHSIVTYTRWLLEAEWLDEYCNAQTGIKLGGEGLTPYLSGGSILSRMSFELYHTLRLQAQRAALKF